MRIIQISDSHIALDAPQRLKDLSECVEAVNSESPEIVIHTGDITHNGEPREYAAAREILDQLDAPYFVLAGNKDKRPELQQAFSDHQYLREGGEFFQYSLQQFPTQLVFLDTVREHSRKGELCEKRLQHCKDMLSNNNKPTLIFMHHSPFEVGEIPDPWQFEDWTQVDALQALLAEFKNVQRIYCGHVHRNVEGSLGSIPVHVLSCMAKDLRKGELSEHEKNQPMYKVIELDVERGI